MRVVARAAVGGRPALSAVPVHSVPRAALSGIGGDCFAADDAVGPVVDPVGEEGDGVDVRLVAGEGLPGVRG